MRNRDYWNRFSWFRMLRTAISKVTPSTIFEPVQHKTMAERISPALSPPGQARAAISSALAAPEQARTATLQYNTLQYLIIPCRTLQYVSVPCYTLQHLTRPTRQYVEWQGVWRERARVWREEQSFNQQINQPINQPINPSINQTSNVSINQTIKQSIDRSIN